MRIETKLRKFGNKCQTYRSSISCFGFFVKVNRIHYKRKKKKHLSNIPLVIVYRKRWLRSCMSPSETAKVIKMKAQIEQQIQALEEQINLEKIALAASNRSVRQN